MPAPLIIRIGFPGAVEQPIRYSSDPRTGFQTTRKWIGPYLSCIGLMPQLQANGWVFDMGSENGVSWTITATIGYSWSNSGLQDNPVDEWDLTSTKVEKELLLSNNAHVAACTATDIKTLQGYLSDPTNANFTDQNSLVKPVTAWRGLDASSASTPLTADGQIVATMLVSGIRSVSIIQPTIRHIQTVSNVYVIPAVAANVGAIISTALLLKSIPASIALAVPPDPAAPFLGALFGWQVGPLDVNASAFNKSKLTQDFVFGAWYTTLYGTPIPAP